MFQVQQALNHDTSVTWVKHTEAPETSTEITIIRTVLNSTMVQYTTYIRLEISVFEERKQ